MCNWNERSHEIFFFVLTNHMACFEVKICTCYLKCIRVGSSVLSPAISADLYAQFAPIVPVMWTKSCCVITQLKVSGSASAVEETLTNQSVEMVDTGHSTRLSVMTHIHTPLRRSHCWKHLGSIFSWCNTSVVFGSHFHVILNFLSFGQTYFVVTF